MATSPKLAVLVAAKLLAVSNVSPSSKVNIGLPPKTPSSLYCTCVFAPPAAILPIEFDDRLAHAKLPVPSVVNMKLLEPPVIVTLLTLPKLAVLVATMLFAVNTLVVLSNVNPATAPKLPSSLN